MDVKLIITVSGRICSGKSYAANILSTKFGFPVASFGSYLKHYCQNHNLSSDRKTLQDVGENFVTENPQQFLVDVINHFKGESDSIIIEGVRHKIILKKINDLVESVVSVFIEAEQKTRFERYINRKQYSEETNTLEHFQLLDSHSVELEIESIKSICDIVVDSKTDYSAELVEFISHKLK